LRFHSNPLIIKYAPKRIVIADANWFWDARVIPYVAKIIPTITPSNFLSSPDIFDLTI